MNLNSQKKSIATWRRPNVLALSLAAFFNDTGADMLFAFYPLFFVMIVAGEGNMKLLGIVETLALFIGMVVRPLTGRIADRSGRKHFIWCGYVLLMISRMTQGLARVWHNLIPPKMLYEIGRGIRNPAREALLADSVPPEERGLAYGLLHSMDTAGAILGPLIGLGLFQLFGYLTSSVSLRYRLIFFAASVPTVMSVLIVLFKTHDIPRTVPSQPDPPKQGSPAAAIAASKTLTLFTILSCVVSLWAVTENFMLVCGAKILNLKPEAIIPAILLYWFINVTFAPTAITAGKLSDRFGQKGFLVASWMLLGLLTMGFVFAGSFLSVALLFAMHGIYQGLMKPCRTALVANLAPVEHRAEVLGSYSMWIGLFAIPAPFIFGLLWDISNWKVPFLVSGGCVFASAVILLLVPFPQRGNADE